jgi:enediyne biosynthesis protein E3
MPNIFRRLMRIRAEEATFARRRFHSSNPASQARLERIGNVFLAGYNAALAEDTLEALLQRLADVELELRGFAFEGSAMGLDILDQLRPWKGGRVQQFLSGPAIPHTYMAHVGVGWSMARLRFSLERRLSHFDPLLRWLVLDGFGFHEGYFQWRRYGDGGSIPAELHGYGLRAFDQGLGRSLWFVAGADIGHIHLLLHPFDLTRRNDLWSGIGLACAYAGGVDAASLEKLRAASGSRWPHLAQGVVFAAAARDRAGNPAPHTESACHQICGLSSRAAVELSENALRNAVEDSDPAYEVWRRNIRRHFTTPGSVCNEESVSVAV